MTRDQVLAELARDGAWTGAQLAARCGAWGCDPIDAFVTRTVAWVKPTAWARHPRPAEIVRLNARGVAAVAAHGLTPQVIRAGELEHALGLAELRWRCGVPYSRYTAQDGLGRIHRHAVARGGAGLGAHLADGVFETDHGPVLCEYDHGRYTARQVRTKLAAFARACAPGRGRAVGAIWGAPTDRRADWLRALGASDVIVMEPDQWLR